MKDNFEGFILSKKQTSGHARAGAKDISISIQKGKDVDMYGFTIRNDFTELILDEDRKYIRFGLKKSLMYFIPVQSSADGYTFHTSKNSTQSTRYASVRQPNFPDLLRFLKTRQTNYDLKYDKNLELYYIDLLEGEEVG